MAFGADDAPLNGTDCKEGAAGLKTANALGLTMPPTLLATADEVIE